MDGRNEMRWMNAWMHEWNANETKWMKWNEIKRDEWMTLMNECIN